jgi:polysaccharide export outer membrane protein
MREMKFFVYLVCLLFSFSSCLTTRQTNLLREDAPVSDGKGLEAIKEYRVCPGDELYISVVSLNQETNALFTSISGKGGAGQGGSKLSSFTIYPDGTIDFPYMESLYVKDKTTLEIKLMLEEKLQVIAKDCSVQVSLGNRMFSVIGESGVGMHGIAKEKTTILEALALSGDVRPYGDRSKVKIIRQTSTGTIVKTFEIRSQSLVNSEYYYVQPNDVIYIQPMGRQFWGIDSFGGVFAFISTLTSIGVMIYSFIK